MMTEDWGTTSTFTKPALSKHNSKANIAARSLDASFFRPSFSRPSETTLQGDLRLKPIRVRQVQRSRMKEPQEIAREQLAKLEKKITTMRGSGTLKAEASFKQKQLQATLSKNTATEERVIALKRTMKTFLKNQGAESERELKCAFHRADIDQSGELDYDEFRDAVRPGVLWCLHFLQTTRVHRTMTWVVSFSSLRPFGRRAGEELRHQDPDRW